MCRLHEDTAWHPIWKEEFDSSPVLRKAIIYGYGPFRPLMSIAHWCVIKHKEPSGATITLFEIFLVPYYQQLHYT